ncbi:MAG: class I SAM-dependent methyltransferase [Bacteroidota bacterium]
MSKEYDQITAEHYAAYRPNLHETILNQYFKGEKSYRLGLDVGCGVGQSAIALTSFCEQVIGIEPSRAMLSQAIPHPKVTYQHYDGLSFDFPDHHFDVITFAGSLFYAKSPALLDEVIRVCQNEAVVVLYDFDLSLDFVLKALGVTLSEPAIAYDHQANFDDLPSNYLIHQKEIQQSINISIAIENIAHLLLSVQSSYVEIAKIFEVNNLHQHVTEKLSTIFESNNLIVATKTYLTTYQIIK